MTVILHDFEARTRLAVKSYGSTLALQASRQGPDVRRTDHGNRTAVTGGKQMNGFCAVVRQLLQDNGMADAEIWPSFGNNLNNRAEEAVGVAHDIFVAYREKAFGERAPRPWLGWLMLVEDCPASQALVEVREPHFKVFAEFQASSYAKRYELLLRKLRLENLFDSTALLLACQDDAETGAYREPAPDLEMRQFLASLGGHIGALAAS
jgi:hypothetical protein